MVVLPSARRARKTPRGTAAGTQVKGVRPPLDSAELPPPVLVRVLNKSTVPGRVDCSCDLSNGEERRRKRNPRHSDRKKQRIRNKMKHKIQEPMLRDAPIKKLVVQLGSSQDPEMREEAFEKLCKIANKSVAHQQQVLRVSGLPFSASRKRDDGVGFTSFSMLSERGSVRDARGGAAEMHKHQPSRSASSWSSTSLSDGGETNRHHRLGRHSRHSRAAGGIQNDLVNKSMSPGPSPSDRHQKWNEIKSAFVSTKFNRIRTRPSCEGGDESIIGRYEVDDKNSGGIGSETLLLTEDSAYPIVTTVLTPPPPPIARGEKAEDATTDARSPKFCGILFRRHRGGDTPLRGFPPFKEEVLGNSAGPPTTKEGTDTTPVARG